MNSSVLLLIIFSISLILIASAFQNCKAKTGCKRNSSAEGLLLKRIDKFNRAFKECDIEQLETLITDDYLHTNGNSKSIGKDAWIGYLEKR